ncbi:S9 family peptidase [Tengunoibacter tsumagoiensis]|uniref:Acyl-peptide hydrolase n=1 Tax=Tengunoibacter tsumagoiensis TaxID=2014871 RepID=A0A401ZV41_9CHLR|nr:prolyl oligopeptidase family serine peptidase [Tengunoibacter tsumagoiensis]GCE10707.1 peptide hydrolase [Tengunoibacter tsumagoiensis]
MQNHQQEPSEWKQRFLAPKILWVPPVSAKPGVVYVLKSDRESQRYAWHVATGKFTLITIGPGGPYATLSPDGRYLYYLRDQQGNEIGHFVRRSIDGGDEQDITPDLPPYATFGLTISSEGTLICLTTADSQGFTVYIIDIDFQGELSSPRLLHRGHYALYKPVLAAQGEIVVMATREYSRQRNWSLLALKTADASYLANLHDGAEWSYEPVSFSPLNGDTRVLAKTNRTGDVRPLLWNPCTGQRQELLLSELAGDVEPLTWSYDGRQILLCHVHQAIQHLYVYSLTTHQLRRLQHPGGTFNMAYPTLQQTFVTQWTDAQHPPQLLAISENGDMWQTILAGEKIEAPCRPWKSVTFASSDGQQIQGWLSTPEATGPFPVIIELHGGPDVVVTEHFSPTSQFWTDHGFAYLTINYRGSTTFGKAFEEQITGNVGHWEVEDIVAARNWLVAENIAYPDQIFLTGWSYGGYLTLLALGTYPDLWAGGMACAAIADWALAYEETSPSLKSGRAMRFGGTPQENPEAYVRSAPLTYAEQVNAPILIVQGRHDTRTPPGSIEHYEAKMRALGKSIKVIWFDGGHYSLRADIKRFMAHQEVLFDFAQRIIAGEVLL